MDAEADPRDALLVQDIGAGSVTEPAAPVGITALRTRAVRHTADSVHAGSTLVAAEALAGLPEALALVDTVARSVGLACSAGEDVAAAVRGLPTSSVQRVAGGLRGTTGVLVTGLTERAALAAAERVVAHTLPGVAELVVAGTGTRGTEPAAAIRRATVRGITVRRAGRTDTTDAAFPRRTAISTTEDPFADAARGEQTRRVGIRTGPVAGAAAAIVRTAGLPRTVLLAGRHTDPVEAGLVESTAGVYAGLIDALTGELRTTEL